MPTITAGGTPITISVPEGKALVVTGAPNTVGVAYRLNEALGGTNSLQSWVVGSGALAPIGPYEGTNKFLITCAAGSISAAVREAVLYVTSGGTPATSPGQPTGLTLTAGVAAVTAAWTDGAAGSAPTTSWELTMLDGRVLPVSTNPATVSAPAGAAITATVRAINSVGPSPASAQSNSVTPTAPAAAVLRVATAENSIPTAAGGQTGMRDYYSRYYFEPTKNCDRLVFGFMNFNMQPGGTSNTGNDYTVTSFSIDDGVRTYQPTFPTSGDNTAVIANGDTDKNTNVVTAAQMGIPVFAAGTRYWLNLFIEVPATGNSVPLMDRFATKSVGCQFSWFDRATTTATNKTGPGPAVFAGAALQNKGTGFTPFVLGYAADSSDTDSWTVIGDSICAGTGDDQRGDGVVGSGFWQRACQDGARKLANINLGRVNVTTIAYNGINAAKAREYLKYGRNFALETDTNDMSAAGMGITLANLQANNTQLTAKARAAGAQKVVRISVFPRADSSSDSFATTGGQSIAVGWQGGGIPSQAMGWYASQAMGGGIFDAYIPLTSVRDSGDMTKWTVVGAPNVQADGTHPLPAGHLKASLDVRPVLYAI